MNRQKTNLGYQNICTKKHKPTEISKLEKAHSKAKFQKKTTDCTIKFPTTWVAILS